MLLISIGICVFDTQKNDPKNPYNNYGTNTLSGRNSLPKAVYGEAQNRQDTSGVFDRRKPENVSQKYRNDPRIGLNRCFANRSWMNEGIRRSSFLTRDASFMDRTNEFDSSFHHRPTIPQSQHMTTQSTFQSGTQKQYQPVHEDDGYIFDEVYDQPIYSEETYEQPYAAQYQPGQAANQRDQAGPGTHQRLNSFVDSFESIN